MHRWSVHFWFVGQGLRQSPHVESASVSHHSPELGTSSHSQTYVSAASQRSSFHSPVARISNQAAAQLRRAVALIGTCDEVAT
jgi:hypothetical protein